MTDELRKELDDCYSKLDIYEKIALWRQLSQDLNYNYLEILTKAEDTKLKEFRHKHYISCKKGHNHGAIGGDEYIYFITGTGIGTIIKVKCPVCGEEEDITDTSKF